MDSFDWNLVVSAASAFGTLALAGMNIWLLCEQRKMNRQTLDEATRAARVRRHVYANVVTTFAASKIWHIAADSQKIEQLTEPTWIEITSLGAMTDESTQNDLFNSVIRMLNQYKLQPQSPSTARQLMEEIFDLANRWAFNPDSVDFLSQ